MQYVMPEEKLPYTTKNSFLNRLEKVENLKKQRKNKQREGHPPGSRGENSSRQNFYKNLSNSDNENTWCDENMWLCFNMRP